MQVPIKRLLNGEGLPLPAYQTTHAAGMDLYAATEGSLELSPGAFGLVPCGFALAIPPGFEAQVRPRSGLAAQHGVTVLNSPGTIDADYRGEVGVLLINHGPAPFVITRGMRIAQLVILPVARTQWVEVSVLPDSERGKGGYGHTGE